MTVRHRLTVRLALVAAALLCAGAASAQIEEELARSKREQAKADLVRYHGMVDAYAAGDDASGIEALLLWSRERLERALALANTRDDTQAPWLPPRYGLAAMLHTDAGLRLSTELARPESYLHVQHATRIWQMGLRLRPDAVRPLAIRWYVAVARHVRNLNAPFVAERLLSTGRQHLPDSPAILFESGTLAEAFATDFALSGVSHALHGELDSSIGISPTVTRRNANLQDAAAWLRRAAALDPSNEMVRLHLGRVQALRLADDEAIEILGRVLEESHDAATAYLAAIFLAGVHHRLLQLEEAAVAYRAGIAKFPYGHAAYVGLSDVLQRAGQADRARQVLLNLLQEDSGPTREPLWWYQFEPPGVADERLADLRKEIRQ